jgi:AraC-like DNA-binding protein
MDNEITVEYKLTLDGDNFKGKGAAEFGGRKQEFDINGTREKKDKQHPAVAFALRAFQDGQPPSISAVVERTGWSQRRFIEVFRDEVGLTPKLFCRVVRFQQVVQKIHRRRQVDWARVAVDCGYYDQAHLIHDFQAFSGFSPTTYLRVHGGHLNHVPLEG